MTRSPSLRPGRIATVIAANHERAVEGAGEYLTDDNNIRQMVSFMGLETQEQLPSHFQVILRIEMIDIDEEVIQVEPVLHRIGQA